MIRDIQLLYDDYMKWLRDKSSLKERGDCIEITTPYLDRHNDHVQIFAKPIGKGQYMLSDAGYTITDLEMSGCALQSPKRKQLLDLTLHGHGVEVRDNVLQIPATRDKWSSSRRRLSHSGNQSQMSQSSTGSG